MSATSSRTAKSARNAGVAVLTQVTVIGLGFVNRSVFVAELGVAMLGVNALLTSIVAMLAFADLGISGALMYALYKPLKDGDTRTTAAIVHYAGRLFRWVALIVAVLGLALTPFLHRFIQLPSDIDYLELYYLILLANTVVGYLMLNRMVLMNADQKGYITQTYSLVFNILRAVLQIVSLLVYESFIVFLAIQVVSTVANKFVVYLRAGRIYPFLKEPLMSITDSQRRSILQSTRDLAIYRVAVLVLDNSTPLLVSVIAGTVALGYYSNYMLIIASAVMVVDAVFSALTPSVGSLIAAGDRGAGRRVFDEMILLAILIHGLIAIGLVTLVDSFVVLWLGEEFVLPREVVVGIVLNFYVTGTQRPLWSFRSATGLFRQTRMVVPITTAISIALSFVLGTAFGLVGIVFAPVLARLLTGAWYEPWLLIRHRLTGGLLPYFGLQIAALALWTMIAALTSSVDKLIPGGPVVTMTANATFLVVVFIVASWVAFRRLEAYQALVQRMRVLVGRKSKGRS